MYREGEPIYQQVAQIIRSNIESGKWPVHTKLPDEIVLSQQLGISRGTLRRALKDLIDQGVLTQIRGGEHLWYPIPWSSIWPAS